MTEGLLLPGAHHALRCAAVANNYVNGALTRRFCYLILTVTGGGGGLPFLFMGRLRHMCQVTQLESGQDRIQIQNCLPGLSLASSIHCAAFLGWGVGGVRRAAQVTGTACANVWQGKCLTTKEPGLERQKREMRGEDGGRGARRADKSRGRASQCSQACAVPHSGMLALVTSSVRSGDLDQNEVFPRFSLKSTSGKFFYLKHGDSAQGSCPNGCG